MRQKNHIKHNAFANLHNHIIKATHSNKTFRGYKKIIPYGYLFKSLLLLFTYYNLVKIFVTGFVDCKNKNLII